MWFSSLSDFGYDYVSKVDANGFSDIGYYHSTQLRHNCFFSSSVSYSLD